jgi:hypothetical protein
MMASCNRLRASKSRNLSACPARASVPSLCNYLCPVVISELTYCVSLICDLTRDSCQLAL